MSETNRSLDRNPPRVKPPTVFVQAALAALERCALYLIPHLPHGHWERLANLLWDIRRALGLPAPKHPWFHLRDWPDDPRAGDALKVLLTRLDELELEKPLTKKRTEKDHASKSSRRHRAA